MNSQPDCQARSAELTLVQAIISLYPDTSSFLNYQSAFELLIGVILSAQCTDAKVNQITPLLFRAFPTPQALALAPLADVERLVHATGFYRAKAAHIVATSQILCQRFAGQVPLTMEELTQLPGVGRKSANVLRGHIGQFPAIIVDTHFKRVCQRLGLTSATDPEKIEADLLTWLPAGLQFQFSMAANRHGRAVCQARAPQCATCPVLALCPTG